jgi:peptide/nickel transport system permease protein
VLEQLQVTTLDLPDEVAPQPRRVLRKLLARPLTLAGATIALVFVATALIGPLVTPRSPDAIIDTAVLAPPSTSFPFGTDDTGRDVLSRIIAGAQISLAVGVVAVTIAMVGGSLLGLVAGYRGAGWIKWSCAAWTSCSPSRTSFWPS